MKSISMSQMYKIEAIIKPFKLDEVREALQEMGLRGITVIRATGRGSHDGFSYTRQYRGEAYEIDLLPKVKIEVVLSENTLAKALEVIQREAKTGRLHDGKIYVSKVDEAIRIRTGETGEDAIDVPRAGAPHPAPQPRRRGGP
jgi:nitrogen regulatory protein P-II 1